MQGGQKVMTFQGNNVSYNIGNAFNIDEKSGTGTGTGAYNLISFTLQTMATSVRHSVDHCSASLMDRYSILV